MKYPREETHVWKGKGRPPPLNSTISRIYQPPEKLPPGTQFFTGSSWRQYDNGLA